MFDLTEDGRYLLINKSEIEALLRCMEEVYDGLVELRDENKHILLAVRGSSKKEEENPF